MKKIVIISLIFILGEMSMVFSQAVFKDLSVGNINARVYSDGRLFNDGFNDRAKFEVPKNSGKHVIFLSGLWIGGHFDFKLPNKPNLLYLSRLFEENNDFTQGPLKIATSSGSDPSLWNRVWKVKKSTILWHINNYKNKSYEIPEEILNWPSNGGSLYAQTLAPFVDLNGNQKYEPEDGDYPDIRGDEAIYFICNDAGKTGDKNDALNVEVHGMLYGFNSTNEALNNTLFLNLKVINRSRRDYKDVFVGMYTDFDIGNPRDDYMGTDTSLNLAYAYNGDINDNSDNNFKGYGTSPPAAGILFLNQKMSNSMFFDNDITKPYAYYPTKLEDYYSYMQSKFLDNSSLRYGGNGYFQSNGATNIVSNYIYPGDPTVNPNIGWTEINNFGASPLTPDDKRIITSFRKDKFIKEEFIEMDIAYLYAENSLNDGTFTRSVVDLKRAARTIKDLYNNGFITSGTVPKVNEILETKIFPNPVKQNQSVFISSPSATAINIFNLNGKLVYENKMQGEIEINTTNFSYGVYLFKIISEEGIILKKIIVR